MALPLSFRRTRVPNHHSPVLCPIPMHPDPVLWPLRWARMMSRSAPPTSSMNVQLQVRVMVLLRNRSLPLIRGVNPPTRADLFCCRNRRNSMSSAYVCRICSPPRQYSHKQSLKRHLSHHNLGKRYSCTICGSKFYEQYMLRRHTRTHSGIKPVNCPICFKPFSRKNYINIHIKRQHPFHRSP